jgi:hypothetical protein
MKKLIIILMLLSSEAMAWGENTSQYRFDDCENAGNYLYRCENKEVICYTFEQGDKGGLSCKFKSK